MEKPRAGEIPQRSLRDRGTLSEGWLLRAVMEMTENLVPVAAPRNANYVFLCVTNAGNVVPFSGAIRANRMREYLARNGIAATTLKALRSSRLTDEWIRTRDPLRVFRLSGNSSLSIVASYVLRHESAAADASAIASVQREMVTRRAVVKGKGNKAAGVLPSHTCLDVFEPSQPKDKFGFCASFLWPYNDVDFILPLEPRPVAFLLRDYEALCEAERNLPRERFVKLYAAKKALIENDYLPLVSDDLRREASVIAAELPSHPPIAFELL